MSNHDPWNSNIHEKRMCKVAPVGTKVFDVRFGVFAVYKKRFIVHICVGSGRFCIIVFCHVELFS